MFDFLVGGDWEMSTLKIENLVETKELDLAELKAVVGGYRHLWNSEFISDYAIGGTGSTHGDSSTRPVKAAALTEYIVLL